MRDLNLGKPVDLTGKKVVVVGGGNVAMDAARSARRLGAEKVTVVYRRRREDMPAEPEEIKAASEEGIAIEPMVNPVAILGDGKVEKVRCVRMVSGEFDSSGRRRTYPVEGSEFDIECDVFIAAIGQNPESDVLKDTGLNINRDGTFAVDPRTMETGIPGVFAAGDCVTGPATVVEAIEGGKKAAAAINQYLGGSPDVVPESKHIRKLTAPVIEEKMPRVVARCLSVEDRVNSFVEVELGYDAREAQREAQRCLRCDVKE